MQKEVNTDYLLWKRVKAGETQAFHDLYMQFADILFSFGLIYSKDQELVKDCIHDLFFDLYKYRRNLSDNDHIRNYLFKSLKRKIQSPQSGKLKLVFTNTFQEEKEQKARPNFLTGNGKFSIFGSRLDYHTRRFRRFWISRLNRSGLWCTGR